MCLKRDCVECATRLASCERVSFALSPYIAAMSACISEFVFHSDLFLLRLYRLYTLHRFSDLSDRIAFSGTRQCALHASSHQSFSNSYASIWLLLLRVRVKSTKSEKRSHDNNSQLPGRILAALLRVAVGTPTCCEDVFYVGLNSQASFSDKFAISGP